MFCKLGRCIFVQLCFASHVRDNSNSFISLISYVNFVSTLAIVPLVDFAIEWLAIVFECICMRTAYGAWLMTVRLYKSAIIIDDPRGRYYERIVNRIGAGGYKWSWLMTIAGSLNGQQRTRVSRCPVIREFVPIGFHDPFTRENQHLTPRM